MHGSLRKYSLGLGVIVLFAVVMLIVVVVQGVSVRQDNQTARKASEIADKLNSYTDSKQQPPTSLVDLKVIDVPDTITYKRFSASSYNFCVTYKAASDNLDFSNATSTLTGQALTQMDTSYGSDVSGGYTPDTVYYLYVDGPHKKGENCQTVQIYDNALMDTGTPNSCNYDYSLPSDQADKAYLDCLDNGTSTDSSKSSI
jgi:hypothetical protein